MEKNVNRKCIWKLFTLTVWEGMWDEWVLLFFRIASPWMLAQGVPRSRALGTHLVWVAITPLPQALPGAKFFLKSVNTGVTALFVFVTSTGFLPSLSLRTSLSVFSVTTIILGKTMSRVWHSYATKETLFVCLWGKRTFKSKLFSNYKDEVIRDGSDLLLWIHHIGKNENHEIRT